MQTTYDILAIIDVLLWTWLAFQLFAGLKKMTILNSEQRLISEQELDPSLPSVSIIVAACNEEDAISTAVESLMEQSYKNYEVIVVNDRSTDNTGNILDSLKSRYSNLKILNIKDLPSGWLGKNHALYSGAMQAHGDWLLFTDGDIIFSSSCLQQAVEYALLKKLDHLTLIPRFTGKNLLSRAFASHLFLLIVAMGRPWRASMPSTPEYVGLGAFNFLKRSTYMDIGTHKAISLRPDDDAKLGKLVKKNGFKQEMAFGKELIQIEWYQNLRQVIKGFEKNTGAISEYRPFLTILSYPFGFIMNIFPFVGLFSGNLFTRLSCLWVVLVIFAMYGVFSKYSANPTWHAFLHPVEGLISIYASCIALFKTLKTGSVTWRGTEYPVETLKRNVV